MANKTRQDLNAEITDIIKSNPGSTDTSKLQGVRHRQLLADVLDYVDEQLARALAASTGNFPFDWTTPSNAFGNYSNSETTFAPGMYKFLHRDMAPRASLSVANALRQKGSSTAIELSYAAAAGTAALASIVVDGTTVALSPPSGAQSRHTATNTDTTYNMVVRDTAGLQGVATASVSYLNRLFIFSNQTDYTSASAATVSSELLNHPGLLSSSRQASSDQNTQRSSNQYIYIAYPVSFGGNPKLIVNNLQDNSFTTTEFTFTNSDNYAEQYYLFKSANLLSSTYVVVIG